MAKCEVIKLTIFSDLLTKKQDNIKDFEQSVAK